FLLSAGITFIQGSLLVLLLILRQPISSFFPYTTLFRSPYVPTPVVLGDRLFLISDDGVASCVEASTGRIVWKERVGGTYFSSPVDRKSTRLNSSHVSISYAVFCLKKKTDLS